MNLSPQHLVNRDRFHPRKSTFPGGKCSEAERLQRFTKGDKLISEMGEIRSPALKSFKAAYPAFEVKEWQDIP